MKKGWEYKKLGEVAEVIHGKNQKDVISANGTYPIYGSGGNVMGYASDYLCETGTTILGRKGSINNPLYIKERFWNVDTAFGISAKEGNDGKYLYYFIKTVDWLKRNTGTTLPSLTQQVVKSVVLPVPPLPEQQRIVDYLDAAFAKIDAMKANAEKSLNEAKALFQASLKEMLEPKEGWEEKKLKDLGQTQTGTTPSKSDKANYGDYMEFIRPSEIDYDGNGGIDYNSEMKLSKQGASNGRIFASNSIFMVCIGATIGKVGFSTKKVSCNQQINVFTPKDEIKYKYAYYAMKSPLFQHRVIKEGSSSQATLPIINKGKWENLSISFPETKEQELIVSHLDNLSSKITELKTNFEKISQECDALKQAILRQIFE